ncbi:50S ribosomal protein L4 [Roseibacillus persicicus]|uniref:Large ribosomal subunit protein uL4 n=1 Tax=Roseibacillus persicicus TaxID=454148 RepID=A0A918TG25_9BACT|nr:50S ribosomal protein L4 [Roseibacillus persicicus]MDQ8191839.1 50S ribosomal protein L4 [Roseibacillus persicicus]GHC44805.1 50S ribosomal protein L4 [Roseibacillus persicicus]
MAKTLSIDEAKAANLTLEEEGRGSQAVHDLVVAYQANRRSGTACAKTRGEVSGNNKKMFRQKGTGNARHGTNKAPIFVGGGVVFGPRPRSYAKTVPRKVRKLALRRVLNDAIAEGKIVSVDSFAIADGKTKSFLKTVNETCAANTVLIIGKSFDEKTYLAGRNVAWAQLETAENVNIEQIMKYQGIILVEDSFETLAARTA